MKALIFSLSAMSLISSLAVADTFVCNTDQDYTKDGYPRTFQVEVDSTHQRGKLSGMPEQYQVVDRLRKTPIEGSIVSEGDGKKITAFRFDSDSTIFITNPNVGERADHIVVARKSGDKFEGSLHIMNFYVPIFCQQQ